MQGWITAWSNGEPVLLDARRFDHCGRPLGPTRPSAPHVSSGLEQVRMADSETPDLRHHLVEMLAHGV